MNAAINEQLQDCMEAMQSILAGGSHNLHGKILTLADLPELQAEISELAGQGATVTAEESYGGLTDRQVKNARLRQYYEAERAVLTGQSYTIGNRQLTRADLATIRKAIDGLLAAGATLSDGAKSPSLSRRVVFFD